MDKELGVTQDYDRSNYDSTNAKREYKEKVFGDSAIITDSTTGEVLHKSQNAAQKKYHMKNASGENVSKKWAKHTAETDHINSLKSIHDKAKHNPFLSDDDVQEIANHDVNLRILPKSWNASKCKKSDIEIILDADNGLSLKGRAHLAKEKLKSDSAGLDIFSSKAYSQINSIILDNVTRYRVEVIKPYYSIDEDSVYTQFNQKVSDVLTVVANLVDKDKLPPNFCDVDVYPDRDVLWKGLEKGEIIGENLIDTVKREFDYSASYYKTWIDWDDIDRVEYGRFGRSKEITMYNYNAQDAVNELEDDLRNAIRYARSDIVDYAFGCVNTLINAYNKKLKACLDEKIQKLKEIKGIHIT